MADCRDAATASEEPGPAARALRATATAADVATDQAYRAFIAHVADCPACRSASADCEGAAGLREIWRDARKAAAR